MLRKIKPQCCVLCTVSPARSEAPSGRRAREQPSFGYCRQNFGFPPLAPVPDVIAYIMTTSWGISHCNAQQCQYSQHCINTKLPKNRTGLHSHTQAVCGLDRRIIRVGLVTNISESNTYVILSHYEFTIFGIGCIGPNCKLFSPGLQLRSLSMDA